MEQAITALELVVEDIDLFLNGSWEPDDDSMTCTQDNVQLALDFLLKLKGE